MDEQALSAILCYLDERLHQIGISTKYRSDTSFAVPGLGDGLGNFLVMVNNEHLAVGTLLSYQQIPLSNPDLFELTLEIIREAHASRKIKTAFGNDR